MALLNSPPETELDERRAKWRLVIMHMRNGLIVNIHVINNTPK